MNKDKSLDFKNIKVCVLINISGLPQQPCPVSSLQSRETGEVWKRAEECPSFSKCFLLSFSFLFFFSLFSLKASHALGSPLEPMSFHKLCEAFVNLHGQGLLIAPIYLGRKHSIAEKTRENVRLRHILFVFLNRNRVEIISSCLPLCFPERSAGFERWKQGRWCVPCSSSSPASPRSCRSSPVTSSRCSVSWTSSGCSVTKMASQVSDLGSLSNYPNGFMSSFTFSVSLCWRIALHFGKYVSKCPLAFSTPKNSAPRKSDVF